MNAMRRKRLYAARARLEDLSNGLRYICEELREVRDDEQDAYDNLPDSIQESSKGETMQEAIDKLEEILDELEDIDLEKHLDEIEEVACI